MRVDVACAVERNFAAHSAVMLLSAIETTVEETLRIHYAHPPRFPGRAKQRLRSMVESRGHEIVFLEVPDAWCRGLPTKDFTRKATWYRIFLPDLIPDSERVVYLDSDLFVLESLAPLWRTYLAGNHLGAVSNVFQHDHVDRPRAIGIPSGQAYFNAGVLLMDLAAMRRDDSAQELRTFSVNNAARLSWRDQDALNLVLGASRLPLHPRWNLMNSILLFEGSGEVFSIAQVEEARRAPAIRHFEGPDANKPWHPECERGMRSRYLELRQRSPWPALRSPTLQGRLRARIEGSA